jgi:DNA invertase Pin-like site-specific DNA recombinase
MRDMAISGRRKGKTHGEKSGRAILNEKQVLDIRSRVSAGERQCDIADEFGVSRGCIMHIVHRLNWRHI